jgi:hypothetical protein
MVDQGRQVSQDNLHTKENGYSLPFFTIILSTGHDPISADSPELYQSFIQMEYCKHI